MAHTASAPVTVSGHSASAGVTVAATSIGHSASASVTVSSPITGHTASASVAVGRKASATVSVEGAITLTPSSITFAHIGSPTQVAAISQGLLTGPYTGSSSSTGVATVTISGTNAFITPVAQGTAVITITDPHGVTATLTAVVGAPAGPTVLSTGLLTFNTGDPSQTFTATRPGDTGPLTFTVVPSGIVSVTGSGNAPGPVTYTVTPLAIGNARININADDGTYVQLQVSVLGTLTAAVTSLKSSNVLTIAVSEIGYTGTITPSFIGGTSATISPGVGYGPTATFTISDAAEGEYFLVSFADSNGASTTLSLQSKNVSLGPVTFTFVDETGINPVAPGSYYAIYYSGDPIVPPEVHDPSSNTNQPSLSFLPPGVVIQGVNDPATLAQYNIPSTTAVTWGFLGVGGTASLTLDEETAYIIQWAGQQAPAQQTMFMTGDAGEMTQTVTVLGYRSPNLSTLGYTAQQLTNWTRGWVGNQYKQPGPPGTTGLAYNLAYSLATLLGDGQGLSTGEIPGLDLFMQNTSVATRLLNCTGSQIDSWFADYLGSTFKRQINESDFAFLVRGLVAINGQVATRTAVTDAANAAWQTLGNAGTIVADDATSNPSLMATLGYAAPYFVVVLPNISVITDAFLLDYRYLGIDDYLLDLGTIQLLSLSSVPVLVQQAVESKRALGTIPLYAQALS